MFSKLQILSEGRSREGENAQWFYQEKSPIG
jgi:hypothetical protein